MGGAVSEVSSQTDWQGQGAGTSPANLGDTLTPQPGSQPDWERVASGQSRRRGRRDTARTLQASLASVYMAEHRLARLMMKELARLQKVAS